MKLKTEVARFFPSVIGRPFKVHSLFPSTLGIAALVASLAACTTWGAPTPEIISRWKAGCRYARPVEVRETVKGVQEYRRSLITQDVDIDTGKILSEDQWRTIKCVWSTNNKGYACTITDASYHPRYEVRELQKNMHVLGDTSILDSQRVDQTDIVDVETGKTLATSTSSNLPYSTSYLPYLNTSSTRTCGGILNDSDVFKH